MKPLVFKKNIKPGTCAVAYCNKRCKGTMCSSCRCRKSRLADPVRYAYNNLKNRAKQRRLVFTITLEQFRDWCHKVKYIGFSKGRTAEGYTIDRKYNDVGYHIDNIQIMKRIDNVKKYFTYDYRTKAMYEIKYSEKQDTEPDYF